MEKSAASRQGIERILEELRPEENGARAEPLDAFARRLLSRASREFLEKRPPGRTVEETAELFRFLEETPAGEIGVRVRRLPDRAHRTLIETVMPDCSFIVDTLREYVHAHELAIVHLLHPVLVLQRDADGRILSVQDRSAEGPRTSVVYILVDGHVEEGASERMQAEILSRLEKVRQANMDFPVMLERCNEVIASLEKAREEFPWRAAEIEEIQELLSWLEEGNFIFLGYRSYTLEEEGGRDVIAVDRDTGLGILRDPSQSRFYETRAVEDLPADLRARAVGGPLLIVSKSNAESPVRRRARMDYIGVKKLRPDGEVSGEQRFLGLFTAKAFAQDASTIPILRRKLREIIEAEGASKGSHDHGLIRQVFNSMPKEELFLVSVSELTRVIEDVMETEGGDEVLVSARPDPLSRGVNVMVILPKHRFSGEVRKRIERILVERYGGGVLNYHLAIGEGDQARLHFYISSDLEDLGVVDVEEVQAEIVRLVRSWDERLTEALEETHEVEEAHRLADRHQGEFSPEYMATMDVDEAVEDIGRLESLASTGVQQVVLEEMEPERDHASRLKVFAPTGVFVLSDVMPMLENLGFRVIEADRYEVGRPEAENRSTIHHFEVETPAAWEVDRAEAEPRVAAALRAVQSRQAENDRLNSLVLSARLSWREVALLRAYGGYAFRIGAVSSRLGVQRPLTEHPRTARLLLEIFEALMDPGRDEQDRDRGARVLVRRFLDSLEEVRSIEDDRTYRRLLNLVQATARTNFYQERAQERDPGMIALKFDCDRIEIMPRPRPRFEVYVNGATTEGAHLRMDDVARGGIRWSDRSEDFRVEVLGLVKTQQIKNAVIVPAGAKGAYVVKSPSQDPGVRKEAGILCYKAFIRGLLDVTDNVVAGEIAHPPQTVVRDGADPYLVVAADKGTATFSDTANSLADEYGFWLGDAFASGGSVGYDHKELGITARGAWECVKRHFRERGVNIQEEEFTVVGIGDMSGDVFGNGMLLSRGIRLVAAFDHRHIFLDPDPDAATSFRERSRLYELPGSTWADYDRDLISKGGGVWERGAKKIELSSQARELLGIEESEVNGDGLIRAILRAPVDLLWNGGIGTYVKASDETHGDVGDPSNDAVRIDGDELRASVVGEGGNLGLTQAGRIEYALRGGRLNTDALDNSAGVDMSDHEVNLKILLNGAMERGRLDPQDRNELLKRVTEPVADRVLRNNYTQSLAVSLDEHRVREKSAEFRDALVMMERAGVLDRQLEFLPTSEQLLEREEQGRYLTRPELSVMLAYAKMHLKRSLLTSELPDDPALRELLHEYFPPAAVRAVGEDVMEDHRLRRRIVSTMLTNHFVDRMGCASHIQLVRETGQSPVDVARAWYVAYRIGEAGELFRKLREMDDRVSAGVQARWLLKMGLVLERATRWLLTNAESQPDTSELIERLSEPVRELREALLGLITERRHREVEDRKAMFEMDGMTEEAAVEFVTFEYLDGLLPVVTLGRETGLDPVRVGEVYFGLTDEVDFPWLQEQLARAAGGDLWEQRAAKTLSLQLELARARMTRNIVRRLGNSEDEVGPAMVRFRREFADDLGRIRHILQDIRASERPTLAALMVLVHAIGDQPLARSTSE